MPHDVADEPDLDARLRSWLAFADQKVGQVTTLGRGLATGARRSTRSSPRRPRRSPTARLRPVSSTARCARARRALSAADRTRSSYDERAAAQEAALDLPFLPTTTIGSFPQTGEIRRTRARHDRGELSTASTRSSSASRSPRVIGLQEELGLDVLVHGEPERNDMVQYFAENLDGFAVTRNGWVQSYGSRATRPSILWGDVSRPAPITVRLARFAQSLTEKPVKGMLTGPVTILAWSFVRDDQPLGDTADQVALALRDEVADLEAAGIRIIQVDEPALRELLPLKKADQAAYLDWSVGSFRLATAGAATATQMHTHLCYSEFGEVIDAISGLDADVTSIEAARSRMEIVADIAASGFDPRHRPGRLRHPLAARALGRRDHLAHRARDRRDPRSASVWINPDCGLKTRAYAETVGLAREHRRGDPTRARAKPVTRLGASSLRGSDAAAAPVAASVSIASVSRPVGRVAGEDHDGVRSV